MQSEKNASVYAPSEIPADFILKFAGNGMDNARIHDGDMVFIKETTNVKDGDVVMAVIDGTYHLRLYRSSEGMYELLAADGNHPPIVISEKRSDAVIIGKAVAVLTYIRPTEGISRRWFHETIHASGADTEDKP